MAQAGFESVIDGLIGRVQVRTPTLPPATHTNAWVLGSRRVTVVDPASPWTEEQELLARALDGREVEGIVLTHHHIDHVSGATDLRRRTGAPILAHPLTAELLDFEVDGLLEDGEVVEVEGHSWTLLFTPGHAPGHLCLHEGTTDTVVAGDMVAGIGTILLAPPEGDLALYFASLAQLKALAPSRLCPAHGPVIEDAVAYLQHYIDHRHHRTDQIRQGLAQAGAALRPEELVPGIYPELPEAFHPVAAAQVRCHLDWLVNRGEVRRSGEDRFLLEARTP